MSSSNRKRKCSIEKDFDPLDNKSKQICLFIEQEEYDRIIQDPQAFRECLDRNMEQYPELFPRTIKQGYKLHGILPESKKMPGIRLRRIELVETEGDTKPVLKIGRASCRERV